MFHSDLGLLRSDEFLARTAGETPHNRQMIAQEEIANAKKRGEIFTVVVACEPCVCATYTNSLGF